MPTPRNIDWIRRLKFAGKLKTVDVAAQQHLRWNSLQNHRQATARRARLIRSVKPNECCRVCIDHLSSVNIGNWWHGRRIRMECQSVYDRLTAVRKEIDSANAQLKRKRITRAHRRSYQLLIKVTRILQSVTVHKLEYPKRHSATCWKWMQNFTNKTHRRQGSVCFVETIARINYWFLNCEFFLVALSSWVWFRFIY